jgi:L-amino acid N-acyltransferase YncA
MAPGTARTGHVKIRAATPGDAQAIAAIYAPIVRDTVISFELVPPTPAEVRTRIENTLREFPYLVSLDQHGEVSAYVYASRFHPRAAYQWTVEVTAYVRADCRRQGHARALYEALFRELTALGYCQACACITVPNLPSVALHESLGFEPIGTFQRVGFKFGAWHDVGWWQKELRWVAAPTPLIPFGTR